MLHSNSMCICRHNCWTCYASSQMERSLGRRSAGKAVDGALSKLMMLSPSLWSSWDGPGVSAILWTMMPNNMRCIHKMLVSNIILWMNSLKWPRLTGKLETVKTQYAQSLTQHHPIHFIQIKRYISIRRKNLYRRYQMLVLDHDYSLKDRQKHVCWLTIKDTLAGSLLRIFCIRKGWSFAKMSKATKWGA